jgi:hypothetical protein
VGFGAHVIIAASPLDASFVFASTAGDESTPPPASVAVLVSAPPPASVVGPLSLLLLEQAASAKVERMAKPSVRSFMRPE